MWCIVNLPNGTQQAVKCDPKAIGQECLEKVCKALNIICETEYFGLEHWYPNEKDSKTRKWINLRNRLSIDSGSCSSNIQLMLALRIKFWVPVHLILQDSVRNLFYMQAKYDLIEGRLNTKDWKKSAKLSALLCQADGIYFNEKCLIADCPIKLKNDNNNKEKINKEPNLVSKKRKLSKQKSIDSIDLTTTSTILTTTNTICSTNINDFIISPLSIYEDYIIKPNGINNYDNIPNDYLREIAIEHEKLNKLKMSSKSAKYWLLKEIQELSGFGEEIFNGTTNNENSIRCDISVGPNGLKVITDDEHKCIPFSAISTAKSFRRTFKLEYIDDNNNEKELEIKLTKHSIAACLYRSITERHAFYVCDKVRFVVTAQFTRDLKGTIASMFKEDTELGKRYVFDIQRTCREVHDQARRILHDRGYKINIFNNNNNDNRYLFNTFDIYNTKNIDDNIKENKAKEDAIENYVDNRISDAMTCKICMDKEINTMFYPCGHVTACIICAERCENCPNCRVKISNVMKVYLPTELRTNRITPTTKILTSAI